MPIRRLKGALLVGEPRSKPLSIQLLLRIKQTNLSLKLSIFLYLRLISSIPSKICLLLKLNNVEIYLFFIISTYFLLDILTLKENLFFLLLG